ncbi:hypothetical protein [Variovorax terrae]|nr:hypothetical protein [Variovorax terrae]
MRFAVSRLSAIASCSARAQSLAALACARAAAAPLLHPPVAQS